MKQRLYDMITPQVMVIYDKMFPLYIVKGAKNFLIDSGVTAKAREFQEKIDQVLKEIGDNPSSSGNFPTASFTPETVLRYGIVSGDPGFGKRPGIDTLLLTHSHWDHTGASSFLQKYYGFDVLASQRTVDLLQKRKVIDFVNRLNQDYKKMVKDTSDTVFDGLDMCRTVVEGERIPVDGDAYFEVIETPGHTKCSISFLLHPWKILFPGDATGVLEQDGAVKPLFLSSYRDYENSILKLVGLGAEVLAFPHNLIIKGKEKVSEHIERSLLRTRDIKDKIIGFLETEKDSEKIAETIYLQEFPKPTLLGHKEALMINLEAMIKCVKSECMD